MYNANLLPLFDLFETNLPSWKSSKTPLLDRLEDVYYEAYELENGKLQVTIDVLGHNANDVKLEVTGDKISIKANKEENSSRLIREIDLTITIGRDYDANQTLAKVSNGLLILTIDKKEERKPKSIQIKVG